IPSNDLVSFYFGVDKFIIHFFGKKKLKTSMEGKLADSTQENEVMFSLSVQSKDEYDIWIKDIKRAGGTIFFDSNKDRKEFYDHNGFYVCVFADPDGHKFKPLYSKNM